MRILIADDSLVSRRLLESVLRKYGYEVVAVSSGSEAWEVLQQDDCPRIAILDWMMPGLSGPEVCRLVRTLNREYYTYILLLTSRNQKEDLIAGMEAGADDYLVKPFDHHELKVRLGPGIRIVELQEELLKARAALIEQATRDSLTGLWNRHTIMEILERELARSRREQTALGVVIADLDRFKSINDVHGHMVGDTVLRETARRMVANTRIYDAVGRYGGEEFLLVLPGCDIQAATRQSERMRAAIESPAIEIPDGRIFITASFGLTSRGGSSNASSDDLIRIADEALYAAKAKGRNCCVALDTDEP